MKRVTTGWLVATLLLAWAGVAAAQAPAQLPVQGFLSDGSGTPVDGDTDMTFSLYAEETGGTALYTETQTVLVDEGRFTAYVGDVTALDLSLFRDNSTVWVGVTVGDGTEMPRFLLGSVPYAAYAEYSGDAQTLGGSAPSDFAAATDLSGLQARVTGTCSAGSSIRAIADDGTVTCETDDVGSGGSSYTAGAGLTLAGTEFAVDTTVVQARVSDTCAAGSAIRAIGADGSVTCEVDDDEDTTYTAGTGLALSGTTFAIDTSAVQARVSGTCSAGSSIRAIAANGTVTCESDTDTNTTYSAGTGLSLSGTTFSVNTSQVQARVSGTCPSGQSIRVISASGGVTCEVDTDTNTTYSAGSGLNLSGTTFSVPTNGITAAHLNLMHGSRYVSQNLVSGDNFLLAPAFTAPQTATCVVNATTFAVVDASDTYSMTHVRTARDVGGTSSNDGRIGPYILPIGGTRSTAAAVTDEWAVTAGTSVRFGCYVYTGGDFVGNTAYCRVDWFCH